MDGILIHHPRTNQEHVSLIRACRNLRRRGGIDTAESGLGQRRNEGFWNGDRDRLRDTSAGRHLNLACTGAEDCRARKDECTRHFERTSDDHNTSTVIFIVAFFEPRQWPVV
jgi:hypothetical protein